MYAILKSLVITYVCYVALLTICAYKCQHSCDEYKRDYYADINARREEWRSDWYAYEEEYADNFSIQ